MSYVFHYEGRHKTPTPAMITRAADSLGIEPAVMEAVIAVEAGGKWYNRDGTFIRRFEPHHMPKSAQRALGFSGGWRAALKLRTSTRRRMFGQAYQMDPEAAVKAASWGAFQIMGFNHERAGYPTAIAMVQAFEEDIEEQLTAFVNFVKFIRADSALRSQDWLTFATKYNGSGQPHVYARKMRTAYARITGYGSPSVVRMGARGRSVEELQKALATRGYLVEVDGQFGPETYQYVRAFQAENDLTVDGAVGAKTWGALRDTAAYSPKPEMEETGGESLSDKMVGVSTAATAGSGVFVAVLGEDPSDLTRQILIGVMGVGALMAGGFYLFRKQSNKRRQDEYRRQY